MRWVPGSNNKGQEFSGRQWLCQKIHKNGVGCGLAEDEGSQGDQEDSVTDHRPPAVEQRVREGLVSQPLMTLLTFIYTKMHVLSHFSHV